MARPNEFVDLKTTSVTVERELLEKAKSQGINISKALRKALADELEGTPKKLEGRLKKFKGLPRHIVNRAKANVIKSSKNAPLTADWLNRDFGVNCSAADVTALVPVF